ncbi:MAG: hypothetical protein V1914_02680 [archaeon]
MKLPKTTKRFCPKCNKQQEMSIAQSKQVGRSKAHPMSRGARSRMRKRGLDRGAGNQGKLSRKPILSRKMYGKKTSKKTDLRYKCKVCNKSTMQKKGFRAKKIEHV